MQLALRPYMTAGVAFAGATAIALSPISPVMPSLPDITVPSAAANFKLTSIQDGIDAYLQLFEDTTDSFVTLFDRAFVDNGLAPILGAIIANQVNIASGFIDGFAASANNIADSIASLPDIIDLAGTLLRNGNVLGATSVLVGAFNTALLTAIAPVAGAFVNSLITPINNFAAVATAVISSGLQLLSSAVLGPVNAVVLSGAAAVQGVIDAFDSGDFGNVIGAFIAAPAVVINNGLLNGFGLAPGLLSTGGPLGALITLRDIVANALSPAPNVTALSAGPESVPGNGKVFSFSTQQGSTGVLDDQGAGQDASGSASAGNDASGGGSVTGGNDGTGGNNVTAGDDQNAAGDDGTQGGDEQNVGGDDGTQAGDEVTGDDGNVGEDNTDDVSGDNETIGTEDNSNAGTENTGGTATNGSENTGSDNAGGTDNAGGGTDNGGGNAGGGNDNGGGATGGDAQ